MPDQLIHELQFIPNHWRLVPTNSNKQPWGKNWQLFPHSPAVFREMLLRDRSIPIRGKTSNYRVRPAGYGLLCGPTEREYLVAIDCDGKDALAQLKQFCNGTIPHTVAFTSGMPNRCQFLFSVPNPSIPLRSRKIGKLEIRGEKHLSILPPSPHPITDGYRWLTDCHPWQAQVAPLPEEIALLMQPEPKPHSPVRQWYKTPFTRTNDNTDIPTAQTLLDRIHTAYADDYHSWIRVGMALHHIAEELLGDWDRWSSRSHKYKPGEPQYKWSTFHANGGITHRYLWWLAQQ